MAKVGVYGSGPWYAWYCNDQTNELQRNHFATKAEAEEQAAKWRQQCEIGDKIGVARGRPVEPSELAGGRDGA